MSRRPRRKKKLKRLPKLSKLLLRKKRRRRPRRPRLKSKLLKLSQRHLGLKQWSNLRLKKLNLLRPQLQSLSYKNIKTCLKRLKKQTKLPNLTSKNKKASINSLIHKKR